MKQFFSRYLKNKTTFTISFLMLLFAAIKTNAQWVELGGKASPFNDYISTIAIDTGGNVYAGGESGERINNQYEEYVAKWNGSTWSVLGDANGYFNGAINTIAVDVKNNVYAGGEFGDGSGFQFLEYVAKWNGTAWSELGGAPFNGSINSIATDAKGNVYAAGSFTDVNKNFYVAKWNGTAWSELGGVSGSFNEAINSIAIDANGNVYAGGEFFDGNVKSYVAKWNGTAWSELGGAPVGGDVNSIVIDAKENVYAAGTFSIDNTDSNYVEKWNGTTWIALGLNTSPFTNHTIFSIGVDANENVYAGGGAKDGRGSVYVAKWNGLTWTELGGSSTPFGMYIGSDAINSIAVSKGGNVYTGGDFIDSNRHYYVAEYAQNILPVILLNFTATKADKDVVINWQTANEVNTSYFNIQRSTDGRSFANIGKVAAKGSNKVNNDYGYVDDKLPQLNADRLYYRLQEVDNDGKFNYSGIKIIELNKNSILFTISPNPAKDYINISASGNVANAQVSVADMNGRTLYAAKQNFTANQQIKIPSSQFAKQVLIVTISTGNDKQAFKVVKE